MLQFATRREMEIPAADMMALLLLATLSIGWMILAGLRHADAALAVAACTSLLFWAPLRLKDYLRHGRVRRNDVLVFLSFAPQKPGQSADVALSGDKAMP
jgi:hypothetical protein